MQNDPSIKYAFIDHQNLHLGIKAQGWKLDFKRFRVYLKEKYGVKQAYAFIGFIPTNQSLYTKLQEAGYVLIFKPVLQPKKEGLKPKGNCDAELVLQTMIEYPNYDKAIIVTSDGDFHCLVKHLKDKGKLEMVLCPNVKNCSQLLRMAAQEKINYIDEKLKQKLEYKNEKAPL